MHPLIKTKENISLPNGPYAGIRLEGGGSKRKHVSTITCFSNSYIYDNESVNEKMGKKSENANICNNYEQNKVESKCKFNKLRFHKLLHSWSIRDGTKKVLGLLILQRIQSA